MEFEVATTPSEPQHTSPATTGAGGGLVIPDLPDPHHLSVVESDECPIKLTHCKPGRRIKLTNNTLSAPYWRCKKSTCRLCAGLRVRDKLAAYGHHFHRAGTVWVAFEMLDSSTWAQRAAEGRDEDEVDRDTRKLARPIQDALRKRAGRVGEEVGWMRVRHYESGPPGAVGLTVVATHDLSADSDHLPRWTEVVPSAALEYLARIPLAIGATIGRVDGGGAWRGLGGQRSLLALPPVDRPGDGRRSDDGRPPGPDDNGWRTFGTVTVSGVEFAEERWPTARQMIVEEIRGRGGQAHLNVTTDLVTWPDDTDRNLVEQAVRAVHRHLDQ